MPCATHRCYSSNIPPPRHARGKYYTQNSRIRLDDRLQRLQARLAEHSLAFNRACIGRGTRILVDRVGRRPGQMIGKSPWLQSVFVETDAPIGAMLDVHITQALPNSLGATGTPQAEAA